MTPQEAFNALCDIIERQSTFDSDLEADHSEADDILCELLLELNLLEIVQAFRRIRKWYA